MSSRPLDPLLPLRLLHREQVMGTIVTLEVFLEDDVAPEQSLPFVQEAVAVLHHADKVFSTERPYSPLSQLRRGEITLGETPLEVTEVLELCLIAKNRTQGWFDPWALSGGVDPSGYVKGWAAQLAITALFEAPITGAIINVAGDIASFGDPGSRGSFYVDIADASAPVTLSCVMELRGAVATTTTYERGEHLLNPFTGEARTCAMSASVTGPDLGLCDAWATALAVGGDEVLRLLELSDGYEALAIGVDGYRQWTSGFPFARRAA